MSAEHECEREPVLTRLYSIMKRLFLYALANGQNNRLVRKRIASCWTQRLPSFRLLVGKHAVLIRCLALKAEFAFSQPVAYRADPNQRLKLL